MFRLAHTKVDACLVASTLMTVAAVGLLSAASGSIPSAAAQESKSKSRKAKKAPGGKFEHGCRVQPPQDFLKRRSFVKARIVDPTKHARALNWLVETYGHVDTEATRAMTSNAAAKHAKTVRFMGLPISVHAKIAPALKCVEKRIRATCKKRTDRYETRALGGFRTENSYRGVEVSNHLFGIAIDLDPEKNPCCGCVEPWSEHRLCNKPVASPYERAAISKCWIKSFERFGFDWLGHDDLEDTMHFEFLGDPDFIKRR
jgi:hypothetical protein